MQASLMKIFIVSIILLFTLGFQQECSSTLTTTYPQEEPAQAIVTVSKETIVETVIVEIPETEVVEKVVTVIVTPPPSFSTWVTLEVQRGSVILESPSLGEVEYFAGDIFVIETDQEFDLERVETAEEGFVRLSYFDDPDIYTKLRPGTVIYFEYLQEGDIRFYQEVGTTVNVIEGSFETYYEVRTHSASIITTGTRHTVEEEERFGNVDIGVQDGEVEVQISDGSKIPVSEGEALAVAKDGSVEDKRETIFVALDISHEDDIVDEFYFSVHKLVPFTQALKLKGYFVRELPKITYGSLLGNDVLLLICPETPLSQDEIMAINQWVDEGHGLFFAGEITTTVFQEDQANQLLEPYGIQFMYVEDKETRLANVLYQDHAITNGVFELPLNWTNAIEGGIELAYSDSGLLILSAYDGKESATEAPQGRVIVHTDATTLTSIDWQLDLPILVPNAIEWLAWR